MASPLPPSWLLASCPPYPCVYVQSFNAVSSHLDLVCYLPLASKWLGLILFDNLYAPQPPPPTAVLALASHWTFPIVFAFVCLFHIVNQRYIIKKNLNWDPCPHQSSLVRLPPPHSIQILWLTFYRHTRWSLRATPSGGGMPIEMLKPTSPHPLTTPIQTHFLCCSFTISCHTTTLLQYQCSIRRQEHEISYNTNAIWQFSNWTTWQGNFTKHTVVLGRHFSMAIAQTRYFAFSNCASFIIFPLSIGLLKISVS